MLLLLLALLATAENILQAHKTLATPVPQGCFQFPLQQYVCLTAKLVTSRHPSVPPALPGSMLHLRPPIHARFVPRESFRNLLRLVVKIATLVII